MRPIEATIEGLRRPEYTGENRCYPCTVVNLAIALVLAVAVLFAVQWTAYPGLAFPAAVAVYGGSCLAIVLRGYLVPGTPTLTKRYFPPWLLSLFGKGDEAVRRSPDANDEEIDVEARLLAAGALEPRSDGDDLQVPADLRADWRAEMDRVAAADADRERLADVLGAEDVELQFETYGDSFRASANARPVGTWESHAAFVADVAAAPLLEERVEDWADLSIQNRGRLLNGMRLFLESCPECEGPLSFGTETVESCCSSHEVAALTCGECDSRIFESEPL